MKPSVTSKQRIFTTHPVPFDLGDEESTLSCHPFVFRPWRLSSLSAAASAAEVFEIPVLFIEQNYCLLIVGSPFSLVEHGGVSRKSDVNVFY